MYLELLFLKFFFQNLNSLLERQHFFTTRCYFLCMSSVRIMNISLVILAYLSPEGLEKTYIDFSHTHFQYALLL